MCYVLGLLSTPKHKRNARVKQVDDAVCNIYRVDFSTFGSTRARSTQLRRFSHLPLVSLCDGDLMTSTRVEKITTGISTLPVFSSF